MTTTPRVGVAALIHRNGKILLLKRHGSHGDGTWSTPGGNLDFGETPAECARREALEEVGVTIGEPRFRTITNDVFVTEGKHYLTVWMEAEWVRGEPRVVSARELTEVGWFSWEALPRPLFLSLENLVRTA